MKKGVKRVLWVLLPLVLPVLCAWVGLMHWHAYRRAHFPEWITLIQSPQYEEAVWRINGKEYGLYDCPAIPGYDIEVKGWNAVEIKEELGCGFYILYAIESSMAESELKFFHFTISSIYSNSPLQSAIYIY